MCRWVHLEPYLPGAMFSSQALLSSGAACPGVSYAGREASLWSRVKLGPIPLARHGFPSSLLRHLFLASRSLGDPLPTCASS